MGAALGCSLGLISLPQSEHTARWRLLLPAGATSLVSKSRAGSRTLTMLQRLTLTLLNTRLCMVVPLLVAGCHPPFNILRYLILPCEVFQLSILRAVYENRTRVFCMASKRNTIIPIRQMLHGLRRICCTHPDRALIAAAATPHRHTLGTWGVPVSYSPLNVAPQGFEPCP